jgi:hypothetical protein
MLNLDQIIEEELQTVSEGKQFGLANRLQAKHDAIDDLLSPATSKPQQEPDDDPVVQMDIGSLLDFD